MNTKPTLVVLAAGMGSRYGGVKQIEPVGPSGEIILEYSIFDAIRAGFGKVVCVIRRDIETEFRDHIVRRFGDSIETVLVYQDRDDLPPGFSVPADRTKPWGTAHAVWSARRAVTTPFAVINADDFYGADAFVQASGFLVAAAASSKLEMCMVGYTLKNTMSEFGSVARGLCEVDSQSYLTRIVEHTKISRAADGSGRIESLLHDGAVVELSGNETVSMNLFGLTPQIFDEIGSGFANFLAEKGSDPKAEYYIPTVVNYIITRGGAERLKVLRTSADWFGITYREDLPATKAAVQRLVSSGIYGKSLWQ